MKEKLKNLVPIVLYFACIFLFACFLMGCLQGCKSFEPIQLQDECKECNDFYNVMKFYAEFDKTPDSAFIGTVYAECQKARYEERLSVRESHCAKIFFKDGVVDEKNYKQYSYYLKCVGGK